MYLSNQGYIVFLKKSDNVFHPPECSALPGTTDPNPYRSYPPFDLRKLIDREKNQKELELMKSALKQWERLYVWPGYPFRMAAKLRMIAYKILKAEVNGPHPENMPYYNDAENPQGFGEIMDSLRNVHDNEDAVRFDYERQGERPEKDIEFGDFSSPSEPPIGDSVKERGSGPDPEGMDAEEPPTGGNLDGYPSLIG